MQEVEEIDYTDFFYHGTGTAKGIEFLLKKKYGRYTGWICYTLGEVEYNFPDFGDDPFPASHDVTHEFKLVNSFKFKKGVVPPTQDATMSADEIRVGGKICFFARFCRVLIKS